MSRKNPQEYTLLGLAKFNEYCSVLAIKELSCYDPDKKTIEKAFRKRALKTHPDKGGDPVEFKKINDAYNRLIGHILKLEQQSEENELANSILIEVSKASIPKWIEKLKRCYGWPKSDDCKCIIFEGAYKQFKGRSKNTGPITLVLYEDPPDNIPKIHIRSLKYMAWIAEQMLPVHMHVEKGRSIQFDQWRIAHVAEFGICAFKTPTPAPQRKQPEPKDPKPKRKARDASEPAPKARRDSEPAPEPAKEPDNMPGKEASKDCTGEAAKAPESEIKMEATNKSAKESDTKNLFQSEVFKMATDPETFNPDEWEEVPETSDPFPKLYNMADQSFTKNGKKYRRKERGEPPKPEVKVSQFNCGHCGINFSNLVEYTRHKMSCVPDENFGLTGDIMDSYGEYLKNKLPKDETKMDCEEKESPAKTEKVEDVKVSGLKFDFLTGDSVKARKKSPEEPSYTCGNCDAGFEKLKEYTSHKISCKESSSMNNKLNDNHVPQNNSKPVQNNFEAPKEKDKKPKTTEELSENKENANLNNISTELPLEKEKEKIKEKISQDISSKDSKVLTKPPKFLKPKKDLKDSQTEDGKPNANKEQRKLVFKSGIDDKSKVEVGKGNIQMESLRESLPPASKTPELEAKLNLEDPREEKKIKQNKSKNDPGEIKHSKTEKFKKSEEVEKEDLTFKSSSTKKEKIKGININGIQPAENIIPDRTIKVKHAIAENKNDGSLTPQGEVDVTKLNSPNTVKKMGVNKNVHSMHSKIKTESEKTTPLLNKTIDGLDNEAIRLSNEIFSFSNPEEEKHNVKDISINTKPKHTYVKTSSKSLAHPLSHGPLDLEAIKLSNEIFSENTKMSLEELQMNESLLQQNKQSSSKADSTKAEKEVITMIEKKTESPEMMKQVQHARQCFVVNKPIQDEKASVFDGSLKKSSSDAEIKPHVKCDDKDLNKPISVSKYKSNEYKNDVHNNRPRFLGLSRFDDPENFKLSPSPSIPNLKSAGSGNHELQRPVRNATFADLSMSKSDFPDLHSLSTSSSFAFESSKSVSPKQIRKTFDRNFNASPSPFSGGKYSVHFSEPQTLSKLGSSLTWVKHSSGSISNNHSSLSASSLVNSSNQSTNSKYQSYPSSTKHSKGELRAKSEGSSTGQTYSVTKPSNNMSADLLRQIQVTKEKHRENCEKALSFEKPQFKPPMYKDKLPRPGNDYARYNTMEREKLARRQEREKTVINKVLAERAGRATSLENKYRI